MGIRFSARRQYALPKMRVHSRMPLGKRLMALVVFVVLLGGAFFFGQYSNQIIPMGNFSNSNDLQRHLSRLSIEHERLTRAAQTAAVNLAIEQSAQRRLLERLNVVETENAGLKQELGFLVKLKRGVALSNS